MGASLNNQAFLSNIEPAFLGDWGRRPHGRMAGVCFATTSARRWPVILPGHLLSDCGGEKDSTVRRRRKAELRGDETEPKGGRAPGWQNARSDEGCTITCNSNCIAAAKRLERTDGGRGIGPGVTAGNTLGWHPGPMSVESKDRQRSVKEAAAWPRRGGEMWVS